MAKAFDKMVDGAAFPLEPHSGNQVPDGYASAESRQVMELVGAAIARLRRDVEAYHPNRPAIAYALAGETHDAIMQQWRQHPVEAQIALLTALQQEATGLLQQLQMRSARMIPTNGYMYGLQDEAIKLEAQAEIAAEEIQRIGAELRMFGTGEILQ